MLALSRVGLQFREKNIPFPVASPFSLQITLSFFIKLSIIHSAAVLNISIPNNFNIEEFVSAGCCILIFISNVAVLFLLERMEYAASEREQLLMLNQQIQLQSKNMTSASELYSAQRKKVHDFRAHLNILNQLMKNQEYSAAEEYLEKITEQQTNRLFLVNTHHPILDALFNTKAAEATQKKSILILKTC